MGLQSCCEKEGNETPIGRDTTVAAKYPNSEDWHLDDPGRTPLGILTEEAALELFQAPVV